MTAILVVGGYGGFGGRLSRRLAARGHQVLVAGRNWAKAEQFCTANPGCVPVVVDRTADFGKMLAVHRPKLIIDAAGPFQNDGLAIPAACVAAGVDYLDLADARTFVTGIGQLDHAARSAGVTVISGASSVPALSGAVVRALAEGMSRITSVEMAISASNRAAAGASVAAAILSYVGKPLPLWRHGRVTTGFGWQELRVEPFSFADGTSLGRRHVALADVPDLSLLPDRISGRPAVVFRAGTELSLQNFVLWLASWSVRWGWLRSLLPMARLLLPMQRLTARLGGDRSGMVVRLFGETGGQRIERRWTLIADDGSGPEIPTLAAVILAERMLADAVEPGARDAGEELTLADFGPPLAALPIRQEIRDLPQPPSLYPRVMGPRFARLAAPVADMHNVLRNGGAFGRAAVTGGANPVARAIGWLMRFPPAGEHPLHVAFDEHEGVERWTRDFGGHRFTSQLSERGHRLCERFGPLRFLFDLPDRDGGLSMIMRGWSAFGLPLPIALAPRSEAREWAEGGRFYFDVPIALPLIGRIVHYRGWLDPHVDFPATPPASAPAPR